MKSATSRMPKVQRPSIHRQSGVALVIALILLVVMTLLGLTAIRSVTLEEKMAGQTFDRSISFQATEAALREAEALVETNKPTPAAGSGCTAGICGLATAGATERWNDSTFAGWTNASAVTSSAVTVTPQYFVEYLGNTFPCVPDDLSKPTDCKRYRITARSNAGNDRANVMLQSIYATE